MDPTPASVGGYLIQSVLGTGGTGTVYLARHAGGLVAVKVLDAECPVPLVHPHIVPVYDHGATTDGNFIHWWNVTTTGART